MPRKRAPTYPSGTHTPSRPKFKPTRHPPPSRASASKPRPTRHPPHLPPTTQFRGHLPGTHHTCRPPRSSGGTYPAPTTPSRPKFKPTRHPPRSNPPPDVDPSITSRAQPAPDLPGTPRRPGKKELRQAAKSEPNLLPGGPTRHLPARSGENPARRTRGALSLGNLGEEGFTLSRS